MPERFIKVTPYVVNNETKWTLSVDGGQPGQPGNYPIAHALKNKGAYDFTVTIDNSGGSNWKFADDALWVSTGGSDPTQPSQVPSEIHPNTIKHLNDTQITFKDLNKKAGDLHYTLNFTDGGNQSSTLDPIIQNGGGGGPGFYSFILDHPIETAAAILLLLAGLWALMRRRAARPEVNMGNTGGTGPV